MLYAIGIGLSLLLIPIYRWFSDALDCADDTPWLGFNRTADMKASLNADRKAKQRPGSKLKGIDESSKYDLAGDPYGEAGFGPVTDLANAHDLSKR